jgi:hypothetical protein
VVVQQCLTSEPEAGEHRDGVLLVDGEFDDDLAHARTQCGGEGVLG